MSVNISIYNNVNAKSNTITLSFEGVMMTTDPMNTVVDYFFKFKTAARDESNVTLPLKIVGNLTNLALNNTKQSATNTANAYSNIREMVIDYTYDYIYGHTADQYTSGCTLQEPMKF